MKGSNKNRHRLGAALRTLRRQRDWTLAELSRRTGLSVPTLSKVENNRISVSYDKLSLLSEGLNVEIGQLFAPPEEVQSQAMGRRSISVNGETQPVAVRNYIYRFICPEVRHKKFIPSVIEPRARSLQEFGELVTHSGEELVYVIEGAVEVHTSLYEPRLLKVGDAMYLDSSMGHAYIAKGNGPCRMLGISSAPLPHLEPPARQAEPTTRASSKSGASARAKAPRRAKRHR